MMSPLNFTPKQTAAAASAGMLTILILGSLAAFTLVIGAFWIVVQVATLAMTSIVEALGSIGATYQAADPMIRFLILISIGYVLYRVGQRFLARR